MSLLTDKGNSIKRLIPLVAFGILTSVLIACFIPTIKIPDNNLKVILEIVDVMKWLILGGFGFTTVEKFSQRGSSSSTKTEVIKEAGNLNKTTEETKDEGNLKQ